MSTENLEVGSGWKFGKRLQVVESEGMKRVVLNGRFYMGWTAGDEGTERMAIVQLNESGSVTQEELAEAFSVHVRSVSNHVAAFRREGSHGLISQMSGPKQSWKVVPDVRAKILVTVLKEGIREYAEIQNRLRERWNQEISIESIRQVLLGSGLVAEKIRTEIGEQGDLFEPVKNESEQSGEIELFAQSGEMPKIRAEQPADTNGDGLYGREEYDAAFAGKQEEDDGWWTRSGLRKYSRAERMYLDGLERGQYSAYAGGLLFAALIKQHRFLETIKRAIDIPTYEGYSLEQLCLTLFYFDVFEFRSIEDFKTVYPEEYGPLIGRASSPSIYTLRRFMHRVRKLKKGEELVDEFCKEYLRSGLVQWGIMYIDGHFLPYYGMLVIAMGWDGVRDKALKGSYQFLAVDEKFNPFIFFLRPSSEDLLEKIPEMIEKARKLGRELGIAVDDLTVIFDREGYSADLFRKLDEMEPKVKFITWAKYMDKWVGDYKDEQFDKSVKVQYEIQKEEEIKYFETERMMNKYGKIRAVVIESGRKQQRSAIFTNSDAPVEKIIQLMCRRWGQETLNKTHKWDHVMDYHPGYVDKELEEQPMVKNPELRELKRQKANAVSKLNELRVKFAQKAFAEAKDEARWKEMKDKHKELCMEMASLQAQITLLGLEIEKFPKEVRFDEAHDGKQLVELDYEKKRFLDCIKVFTYMMEKKMCSILSKYYDDPKDVYVILSMIVRRGGELKLEGGRLSVRLKGFKNPDVDFAARHLCGELNQMQPRTLDKYQCPIRYEVA